MTDDRFQTLMKIRNTSKLADLILSDFAGYEQFNRANPNFQQVTNERNLINGSIFANGNYRIDLRQVSGRCNSDKTLTSAILDFITSKSTSIPYDFTCIDTDLLKKIIQSCLNYTDLELHPDGVLELKLPQVSY